MDEVGRDIERAFWTSILLLGVAVVAAVFGTVKAVGALRYHTVVR